MSNDQILDDSIREERVSKEEDSEDTGGNS